MSSSGRWRYAPRPPRRSRSEPGHRGSNARPPELVPPFYRRGCNLLRPSWRANDPLRRSLLLPPNWQPSGRSSCEANCPRPTQGRLPLRPRWHRPGDVSSASEDARRQRLLGTALAGSPRQCAAGGSLPSSRPPLRSAPPTHTSGRAAKRCRVQLVWRQQRRPWESWQPRGQRRRGTMSGPRPCRTSERCSLRRMMVLSEMLLLGFLRGWRDGAPRPKVRVRDRWTRVQTQASRRASCRQLHGWWRSPAWRSGVACGSSPSGALLEMAC
mmetsp:Transcript_47859/g.121424  ORF Transcript_47859/g.121424 Transcript_47859/m.121424 type:complete len:269 (+) Transcript_47859:218-1024(+)